MEGVSSFTGHVNAGELEGYREPTLHLYKGIVWTMQYNGYVCSDIWFMILNFKWKCNVAYRNIGREGVRTTGE